jgi:hypothetical protein
VLTALSELLVAEFGYSPGRDFLRLEGSVSAAQRSKMIALFNRPGSHAKVGAGSWPAAHVWVHCSSEVLF